MPGRRGILPVKQRDVARAIRGARSAGVNVGRVDINPRDGTVSIIIPAPLASEAQQTNEWDRALGKPPLKVRPRI
jgi:hypothetical protein